MFASDFGTQILYGGRGADLVQGFQGTDTAYGGQGPDQVFGFTGNDLLSGGQGIDTVGNAAEAGDDGLMGGPGPTHSTAVPARTR